ncbi:MAG: HEPN domain-containing protein [bacterium]|nr:HEPN domain-containing protein [bacterium]
MANENLLSAKILIDEEFSPYHTVCFMCQGSAEKYIKAYLIWNGWELEKIHDMEELLKYAIKLDTSFEELRDECKLLNEYITSGRYPGDLPWEMIGKPQADEAIEAAEKIEKVVSKRMNLDK